MSKSIVFDLGGTLMEFVGMPLNWSDYYIGGFEKLNEILKLNLSENGIQESANKLKAYNPRTSKREYEIKPEVIFTDIMTNWGEKPDTNKVIELFFESLSLKANIYEYSIELLQKCRDLGFKTACLTDLPNGMPDCIFKPAIEEILPYFDLYVSSQICGVRKPNQGGICYIADVFEIREAEILFVGDELKEFVQLIAADEATRLPENQIQQLLESGEFQALNKKTMMRLSKADDHKRRVKLIAYKLAKDANNPHWGKMMTWRGKWKGERDEILKIFGKKAEKIAKLAQKEYIKKAKKAS